MRYYQTQEVWIMKLLVIGASKGIGREVVKQALAHGHTVRALARSADALAEADGLERQVGDATEPGDVAVAVTGMDAVIMTLGVPKNLRFLISPVTLFSSATKALIPAMTTAGVKRLLVVTGFGAGDSAAKLSRLESIPFRLFLGRAYADKGLQEAMVKASDLDWTIARPGILTDNKGTGKYRVLVDPATWRQGLISRADVAHYLLEAVENGLHIHETPAIQR
jgi:putative NADH-flavin reductase